MVSIGLIIVLLALAAWLVVYFTLKDKLHGRVSLYPFGVIVRIGVSKEPLKGGVAGKALSAYGYLSILVMAISTLAFYYLAIRTASARLSPEGGGGEAAGFIPLIPGVTIPWDNLVYVAIALGVGVLFHELAHAVVAVAEGIRVKDAGLALFLFVPAAFVELDEDQLSKARLISRLKVFSAGVAANMLIALLILASLAALPIVEPSGIKIVGVEEGSPAEAAGLEEGMVILTINGTPVKSLEDLRQEFEKAGVTDPDSEARVLLIVERENGFREALELVKPPGRDTVGIRVIEFYNSPVAALVNALVVLNVGVGLINAAPLLLPLPGASVLSDGGHVAIHLGERLMGRAGRYLGAALSLSTLILILGLLSFQPLDFTP